MTNIAPEQPITSSLNESVKKLLSEITYKQMVVPSERQKVFQLRYKAYLWEGAITPRPDEQLSDRFDEAPNAIVYGIFLGDALVSSLRLNIVSSESPFSPALSAFPDALAEPVQRGLTIVDPNRFVVDPEFERSSHIPYVTTRLGYMAAKHFNADMVTATVRAEHQAFYRRVFRLAPVCPPRPYATLIKPLSLMTCQFREVEYPIRERYPFFASSPDERNRLFGDFFRPDSAYARAFERSRSSKDVRDHHRSSL